MSSLFALIIGINEYLDHSDGLTNLTSAVPDAQSVERFLKTQLQVPPKRIRLLTDRQATHNGIISTFRSHLIDNTSINYGDPILFYYAGHGSRVPAEEGWTTDDGQYESICPSDRNTKGADGKDIGDILDRNLGIHLLELSRLKGNNITVIMDCCHSGSGTRGLAADGDQEAISVRQHPRQAPPIQNRAVIASMFTETLETADLFKNSISRHTTRLPNLYQPRPDLSSHILMAACRQDQLAWENKDGSGGLFTDCLLERLKKCALHRSTYKSIMDEIGPFQQPLPDGDGKWVWHTQTPQCEGPNKRKILFDGKALGVDKRTIRMRATEDPTGATKDPTWEIAAGSIHGVTKGTVFLVRRSEFHSSISNPCGRAVAVDVHTTSSVVKPDGSQFSPPKKGRVYASVLFWNNPPFTVAFRPSGNDPQRRSIVEAAFRKVEAGDRDINDEDMQIALSDPADAKLIISIQPNKVVFERRDPLISEHCKSPSEDGSYFSWDRVGSHSEWEIINQAARFTFDLYRENPDHPYANSIALELCCVDMMTDDMTTIYTHDPSNGTSPACANVQFDDSEETGYAIRVHNNSDVDLFVSLFYFDPSEYSVTRVYSPPAENMGPPLKKKSYLTLGGYSSGIPPFGLSLKEGEEQDVGFMKLFFSNEGADLDLMELLPGFQFVHANAEKERNQKERDALSERSAGEQISNKDGKWDSVVMPVAVHRSL